MAMVRYGGGVIQMKGKVSGNIHTRDKFCNHINSFPRIIKKTPTASQRLRRYTFSKLIHRFSRIITIQQRTLWKLYSYAHPIKNKLGETIFLQANDWYLKFNLNLVIAGNPPTDTPPF